MDWLNLSRKHGFVNCRHSITETLLIGGKTPNTQTSYRKRHFLSIDCWSNHPYGAFSHILKEMSRFEQKTLSLCGFHIQKVIENKMNNGLRNDWWIWTQLISQKITLWIKRFNRKLSCHEDAYGSRSYLYHQQAKSYVFYNPWKETFDNITRNKGKATFS